MQKTILKPYPQGDPDKGTTTRFGTLETQPDSEGVLHQVEVLKPIEPSLPVSEFVYDAESGTGSFRFVVDSAG
ncbi:MAG: hypothetical protein EOO94_05040, partial [Pedobacter sp.]